jgi:CelD/BcsL family acetyltransferase involved in cellulose biosynthesis
MTDLWLDVVTDDEGFAALRGDWADVASADPDPNVFLTWPWAHTWWQHFGQGRPHHTLHIVVVRDPQGVVGIAPLYRSRVGAGPVRTTALQRINHDSGDYGGMLLARRPDETVALLVDHLGAQLLGGVAVVVLTRLASDARFTRLLGDELVRHAATLETVVDQLDGACLYTDVRDGFDLAKQAKKHKIRQRTRRLDEQHGDVAFVEHTGATLEAGLDRLVDLHDRRWEEIDEPMQGLLASAERREFLFDAIRALDAEGMVTLLSIEAAGKPVAVELDFVHENRVFLFKGAFDPEFAAFSPGQLLHHRVFEDGLADGVDVFDFCRGDALYKRRWANGERHLSTVMLSRPGLAGAVARQRFRATRALARRMDARRSTSPEATDDPVESADSP